MKYSKVYLEALSYELPPVVVSTTELEERLAPLYKDLRIQMGQLEVLTGIEERRWWEPGFPLSEGASKAGAKALEQSGLSPSDIGVLIYGGVCRESFEPATACRVAANLKIRGETLIYDISNACLGVLNGIVEIANKIELGQIKAGMIVSCESARDINDTMIQKMLEKREMDFFAKSLATLTGGSGAIALILTDGSFSPVRKRRLKGGVALTEPKFYDLCRWYADAGSSPEQAQFMRTDSVSVLKNGVVLGEKTWNTFLKEMEWEGDQIDKVICHQVGSSHQASILNSLGIPKEKDFTTFPYLGNIGTVSVPITAAFAEERDFLNSGDRVAFLGIGSGLNCMMLGWEW